MVAVNILLLFIWTSCGSRPHGDYVKKVIIFNTTRINSIGFFLCYYLWYIYKGDETMSLGAPIRGKRFLWSG